MSSEHPTQPCDTPSLELARAEAETRLVLAELCYRVPAPVDETETWRPEA